MIFGQNQSHSFVRRFTILHCDKQRDITLQTVFKESIERFNVNDNKPLTLSIEPLKNSILRATLQKTLHMT